MKDNKIENYDKNGRLIHSKDIVSGFEYWVEYDYSGKEIHYIDSDGYEYWKEYSYRNGEYIQRFKNNCGYDLERPCDPTGRLIIEDDTKSKREKKSK